MVKQPGVFEDGCGVGLFPHGQHGFIGCVLWGGFDAEAELGHGHLLVIREDSIALYCLCQTSWTRDVLLYLISRRCVSIQDVRQL